MRNRWPLIVLASLSLVGCSDGTSRAEDLKTLSAEEIFRRSGDAYRVTPGLEITLNASVQFPNAAGGERVIRYVLGEGTEAVIEIDELLRIVSTGDSLQIERDGVDGRFLAVPLDGDLGTTLANMRGRAGLAGVRESPQAALRAGKPIAAVLYALRFSNHLGELTLVDSRRLPDSRHEVLLEADNGSCTARFDPETFFLEEIEQAIRPTGAPDEFVVRIAGIYETTVLDVAQAAQPMEPRDRTVVTEFPDLAPPAPGVSDSTRDVLSPQELAENLIDIDELAESARDKRVLLVGEDHLYNEPPVYLTDLLDRLPDGPVSILLELPYVVQPDIERFIEEGDEQALGSFGWGYRVVRW